MSYNKSAVEAILFAAGDSVSAVRISKVLGTNVAEILSLADEIAKDYENRDAGIRLLRLEDKLQIVSATEYSTEIEHCLEKRVQPKLSPTALEVLAIVAYYQPVTRAYIEKLRGTDASYTIALLSERGLIQPVGRLEAPGRPILYGTTEQFLRIVGITALDELPPLPNVATDDGLADLQSAIQAQSVDLNQLEIKELEEVAD